MVQPPPAPTAARLSVLLRAGQGRVTWTIVLAMHLVAAMGWVWAMPGGFPWTHARFWSNRVFPIVIAIAACAGLAALLRKRFAAAGTVLLAIALMWIAASLAGRLIFPISAQRFWLAGLVIGTLLAWRAIPLYRLHHRPGGLPLLTLAAGALLGAALPWSQRGGEPTTNAFTRPTAPRVETIATMSGGRRIEGDVMVWPQTASITTPLGRGVTIEIHPMLEFISVSPDRAWTSLVPRWRRELPPSQMFGSLRSDEGIHMVYRGAFMSDMKVTFPGDGQPLRIVSHAWLTEPIYSHLNSYARITIERHRRLSLAFSPCRDVRIDVTHSEYPVGAPARMAYLGADGVFRVVEASSGEKGPFRELAAGDLERGKSLEIVIYDEDEPVGAVALHDFTFHAGTDLSPTAGWGLPQNAVEFSRATPDPASSAAIWVTLAGTPVGRGWDSVGHAAGVYRNRVTIERR